MESGIEILDDSSCNNTVEAKPTPETPAVEEDSKPAAAETEKEAAESDEAPLAKVSCNDELAVRDGMGVLKSCTKNQDNVCMYV